MWVQPGAVRKIFPKILIYIATWRKRQESNLPKTPARLPTGLKPARPTGSGTLPPRQYAVFQPCHLPSAAILPFLGCTREAALKLLFLAIRNAGVRRRR